MTRDYIARELPCRSGTRRRVLGRFTFLHQACEIAEAVSREGRYTVIELHGLTMVAFFNGQRLPARERTTPASAT